MDKTPLRFVERKEVLLRCIDLEIAVSLIYREFAELFPAERDFWEQLAHEEEDHARIYMAADILQVAGAYQGIGFPPRALIVKTIEFTEHVKELLKSRSLSLREALDIALQIEKTVAESMIFELPVSDNPVIANLKKVLAETELHVDRIEMFRMEKGFSFPA